jgi:hypothetical protein
MPSLIESNTAVRSSIGTGKKTHPKSALEGGFSQTTSGSFV